MEFVNSSGPVWQSIVDGQSGQTYYYNRLTGESRWDLPAEAEAEEPYVAPPPPAHSETAELELFGQHREDAAATATTTTASEDGNFYIICSANNVWGGDDFGWTMLSSLKDRLSSIIAMPTTNPSSRGLPRASPHSNEGALLYGLCTRNQWGGTTLVSLDPASGTTQKLARLTFKGHPCRVASICYSSWIGGVNHLYGILCHGDPSIGAPRTDCIARINPRTGECHVEMVMPRCDIVSISAPPLTGGPWHGVVFFLWGTGGGLLGVHWQNDGGRVERISRQGGGSADITDLSFTARGVLCAIGPTGIFTVDTNAGNVTWQTALPAGCAGGDAFVVQRTRVQPNETPQQMHSRRRNSSIVGPYGYNADIAVHDHEEYEEVIEAEFEYNSYTEKSSTNTDSYLNWYNMQQEKTKSKHGQELYAWQQHSYKEKNYAYNDENMRMALHVHAPQQDKIEGAMSAETVKAQGRARREAERKKREEELANAARQALLDRQALKAKIKEREKEATGEAEREREMARREHERELQERENEKEREMERVRAKKAADWALKQQKEAARQIKREKELERIRREAEVAFQREQEETTRLLRERTLQEEERRLAKEESDRQRKAALDADRATLLAKEKAAQAQMDELRRREDALRAREEMLAREFDEASKRRASLAAARERVSKAEHNAQTQFEEIKKSEALAQERLLQQQRDVQALRAMELEKERMREREMEDARNMEKEREAMEWAMLRQQQEAMLARQKLELEREKEIEREKARLRETEARDREMELAKQREKQAHAARRAARKLEKERAILQRQQELAAAAAESRRVAAAARKTKMSNIGSAQVASNLIQDRKPNMGAGDEIATLGQGVFHEATTYDGAFHEWYSEYNGQQKLVVSDASGTVWILDNPETMSWSPVWRPLSSDDGNKQGQWQANVQVDNLAASNNAFGVVWGSSGDRLLLLDVRRRTIQRSIKLTLKSHVDSCTTKPISRLFGLCFSSWLQNEEQLYGVCEVGGGVVNRRDGENRHVIVRISLDTGVCEAIQETNRHDIESLAAPPLTGGPWHGVVFFFLAHSGGLYAVHWANEGGRIDHIRGHHYAGGSSSTENAMAFDVSGLLYCAAEGGTVLSLLDPKTGGKKVLAPLCPGGGSAQGIAWVNMW